MDQERISIEADKILLFINEALKVSSKKTKPVHKNLRFRGK